MNTIAIKSSKDKIVVTFDKTESNVDILLKFLDRLEIEQKAKKIDFSKDILKRIMKKQMSCAGKSMKMIPLFLL